jgi:signal transduction histidine kinase
MPTDNPVDALTDDGSRTARRLRIEGAMLEVSRLLIAGGKLDLEAVLRTMGEAVGADSAYFLFLPADDVIMGGDASPSDMDIAVWHRQTERADWQPPVLNTLLPRVSIKARALAVPILSGDDRLYAYLGFEYGTHRPQEIEQDTRVLNLLGDLFAVYFERRSAEEALRRSEERYRTFIETISEGIWRIEFADRIRIDIPEEEQIDAILALGHLAECNDVMARFFGVSDASTVIGMGIIAASTTLDLAVVEDFVNSGYRLFSRDYSVALGDARVRHFVVNAVGTVEDGCLSHIWGSCIDVTEQVEFEHRMVAALEEQQQRIGHDLHDGVGQLLTGIRMLSRNLYDRYFTGNADGRQHAERVAEFADQASERVRDIYRGLTPVLLHEEGLAVALEELCHHTDILPGIRCRFEHDQITEVEERDSRLHLYRIAQEAVNNALKHGDAGQIVIRFGMEGRRTILEVSDDGKGFDPAEVRRRRRISLGLDSMLYRARAVGARMSFDSAEGKGTRIRCILKK